MKGDRTRQIPTGTTSGTAGASAVRRDKARNRIRLAAALTIVAVIALGALAVAQRPYAAVGVFSLDRLRLGNAAGPENTLFTTGNVVYPDGGVDAGTYYRFVVTDARNVVRNPTFPCTPAASFASSDNTYTIAASDLVSTAAAWKFTLNEYADSACTGTPAKTIAKTFNVARANTYADTGLTTPRSSFAAGSTVYMTVAGLTPSSNDWSVTWLLPSGAVACANTAGNDRPDANSDGVLPPRTSPPYLQYRPDPASGAIWNREQKYETTPCADLAAATEGTWKLRLERNATTFVVLDAFNVDATPPPPPVIGSGPPTPTNLTSASFTFSASEPVTSFQCALDAAPYLPCVSPQTYTGLADGAHTFSVRALDAPGNAGAATDYRWSVDTTTPVVTLELPADGAAVNTATPTFTGTAGTASGDANVVEVDVYAGSSASGTPLVTLFPGTLPGGAYSATSSLLAEGTYTARSRQADGAGNIGASEPHTFRIDLTVPSATITAAPPAVSTSSDATFGFTANETGSTFGCGLDGGAFVACTSPHTYSGLAEGSHSFAVRATDAAGNTGAASIHDWTVDSIAPVTTISSAPADPTSSTEASFTFDANEAGSTFSCSLDGGAFVTCTNPESYSGLAEGSHTLGVRAQDAAGNVGAAATHTWTVDTTAPSTTISAAPGNPANSSEAGFTFSASEGGVTFACSLDEAAFVACTSPHTYSGLAEGSHSFAVRATDAVGNAGAAATYQWRIDTAAPAVTLTMPVNGTAVESSTPTFAGGAGVAEGDSSVVLVNVYTGTTATGTPAQTLSATVAGDAWVATSAAPLPPGSYTARAEQADTAGNVGLSAAHTFTIDTSGPTVTIENHPADPTNATAAVFVFSANEAGSSFECRLDGGGFGACSSPHSYSGLAEGSHGFAVRATDAAGNTGAAASFSWRVDTTEPAVTITSTPTDPSGVSTASFAFASNEAGSTFECRLDAEGFAACDSPRDFDSLADGSHSFHVRATDAAGNTGAAESFTWTIDTSLPATTILARPNDPSNATEATFQFSANRPNATFACRLDGGSVTPCSSPKTYSGLGEGEHAFAVEATSAGITGPPATATWTVDTTPPTTTIDAAPADPTAAADATFTFTASESDSTFECRLDGGTLTACASPESYAALAEGAHTFGVKATDAAGNVGAETTHNWTIDATGPGVTIEAHPADPTNATGASFAFSAGQPGLSFECSLDASPFSACTSPQSYGGLTPGTHTFAVKATDPVGNTGAATSFTWAIDTTPPETTLVTTPANPTSSTTAEFAFASDSLGATFECRLDAGVFGPCASPQTYIDLADGTHTFDVRAHDPAGNVDSTPAGYSWTIDATAPAVTLTTPTEGATLATATPAFAGGAGSAAGDSSTVEVNVYAGASATGSPVQTLTVTRTAGTWTATAAPALPDGGYTVRAEQADDVGNRGRSAAHQFTVDTSRPSVTIDTHPPAATSSSSAGFGFSTNEPGATFQCRLDGAAFATCTSPKSYTGLADGGHTFTVNATDFAGNTSGNASFTWTVDTVPPDTSIPTRPPDPAVSSSASFGLASNEPDATFECRLDGAPFAACAGTVSYSGLADGSHTFDARAKDVAGTVDPTAASYAWTIDTVAPQTTITTKPTDPTNATSAGFAFTANENGGTFSCQLDGGGYASCTSPKSYAGLASGSHTFAVRATDAAGNTGAAASYTWSIDTTAPTVTLTSPSGGSTSATPTFSGSAGTAAGDSATITVKVYSGSAATGTPVQTLTAPRQDGTYSVTASLPLTAGTYTAQAEQSDAAGNTGRSGAVTFGVGSGYRAAVLAEAPGGYWRLGESSGTTAADQTGTSAGTYQNGVLLGQPGALATDPDTAASFDGVDDIVSVPSAAGLNATSGVTVEAWIKRTKTGAWQNIAAKPGNGGAAAQNYALWVNTTNQIVGVFGNGSSSLLVYSPAIDTNWHHVVATYDNAVAKVYVDGVLKASATPASTLQLTTNTSPLTIGRTTDNNRIFGGRIDEVAVYTGALSAAQILAHYDAATSIDTTAPVVTLTTPANGSTTDNQTPTYSGAAGTDPGDAAAVTVKVYEGTTATGTPVQTLSAAAVTGGTWSITPTTPLADGAYTVQAEQSDSAGNVGRSATSTFTITADDLTPPAVTLTTPGNGSSTSDTTPRLSGGAGTAPGDLPTITVKIWKGVTPSGTPVQTLTTTETGASWSVDAAVLAPGVYAARAQQVDTAENTGLSAPHSFTIGTSYPDEVLADAPGGYWRLGEVSGTTAADRTGANAGTYINGVTLGQPGALTGDVDTAASFDGVNDYISVPSSSSLNATTGVTVEAWVKRTRSGAWQNVVAKPGNGAVAAQNYALWVNTLNQITFFFGNGSATGSVTGPVLDTNWHFVAATYDNATAKIYIDGVLQASATSPVRLTANTNPLTIGRSTDNLRVFGGLIDEPAVYRTALSAARIQTHYIKGNAIDNDPPVVTLTTPDSGSSTLNRIPHFAGQAATTASDATTVTVRIYSGTNATGTPLQTMTAPWFTSGAWSVDAAATLPLGIYTAQAEQTDVAGNIGKSDANTFTIVAASASSDPVLAGAGDIADCTDTGVAATANLILGLPVSTTVQTFGDNAYPHGSANDFSSCYDPHWGAFKARTHPAIGDHEYETQNASGYFNYFQQQLAPHGASATDPNRAWYSYDLGSWHIVVLNGACADAPACSPVTQAAWLDSDLSAHTNQCTLAVLDSPRWSSGSVHGSNATMAGYFDVLYDHGAELILSGDDHVYERFAPTDPQGFYDPSRGVRQIIAGTGGGSLYTFGSIRANSEVRKSGSYGILKLTLRAGGYEWEFIPTSGTFSDSGTTSCH